MTNSEWDNFNRLVYLMLYNFLGRSNNAYISIPLQAWSIISYKDEQKAYKDCQIANPNMPQCISRKEVCAGITDIKPDSMLHNINRLLCDIEWLLFVTHEE